MHKVGVGLSIGDGYPDEKLKFGIQALQKIKTEAPEAQTSVFIKPYSNERIFERFEWAKDCVKVAGVDIDSYNIVTMRNLVKLEKKTAAQLIEIKNHVKIPFAIKGIFTQEDIELVKEVKPDIVYISNHGGRVDTRKGSTAEFFAEHVDELKNYCDEIWVDGGIRSPRDVATAMALGADCVLIGRPFASALCHGGPEELCGKVLELSLLKYGF
jgi:isopentenyl diphosphate isomerase/L-lactate dehydrogenase-like FMN-dependent dehydrogenase